MMPRALPPIPALLMLASCAQRIETLHPAPAPGVNAVMKRQIENALDAGEGDLGGQALRRKVAAEPGNLKARLALAAHYERLGSFELAVDHCRIGMARHPESAEFALVLARLLHRMGMRAQAVETLMTFAGAPTYEIPALLGVLLDEEGKLAEAEIAHRKAVALGPQVSRAHNNLGHNLRMQGKRDEAAAQFRRALELDPRSEIARNNLGLALSANPKEALMQWESVSGPAAAHNNMAAVLIEQGRYAEARKELEVALQYRKDHAAALHNLQLISELDGGSASVSYSHASHSVWKRFTISLRRLLTGKESAAAPEPAVETASK